MTKLASALPKGDSNGLDGLARDLVDDPHRMHAVIAVLDCSKIITSTDTGEVEPTARVRRIERVLDADLTAAERLLRRALEKRAGDTQLPIDLEEELEEIFGQGVTLDLGTGELTGGDATSDPDFDDDGGEDS